MFFFFVCAAAERCVIQQEAQGDGINTLHAFALKFYKHFENFMTFTAYNAEPFILVCTIDQNNRGNYISFGYT